MLLKELEIYIRNENLIEHQRIASIQLEYPLEKIDISNYSVLGNTFNGNTINKLENSYGDLSLVITNSMRDNIGFIYLKKDWPNLYMASELVVTNFKKGIM